MRKIDNIIKFKANVMYFFVLFEMLYNVEKEKETQTSHKSRASYQDEGNDSDAIVHKLT